MLLYKGGEENRVERGIRFYIGNIWEGIYLFNYIR